MPKTLESIVGNLKVVPALPELVVKLMSMLDDPEVKISDVAKVISKDPGLGVQILKTVNSAFYSLNSRIGNIDRAITILGFREIKNIVLANSVSKSFKGYKGITDLSIMDFWKHSLVNGCVMRCMARKTHCPGGGDAFSIGLLHDIGKLVLISAAPQETEEIVRIAREKELAFCEAEQDVLETTHSKIGGWLLNEWRLPEAFTNIITGHHDKQAYETDPLTGCCYFGNFIAELKNVGGSGSFSKMRLSGRAWSMLGMERGDLKAMIALANKEIEKADTILENLISNTT